nr:MAG TPA: hypothetical protein [Bacteriophage sp.]
MKNNKNYANPNYEEDEKILPDPEEEKYGNMEINQDEDFHNWSDEKIKNEIKNLEDKINEAVKNFPSDFMTRVLKQLQWIK